jgi:hypothetical protein
MGKSKWLSLVEAGCRVLGRLPFVDNRAIKTARDQQKKIFEGKISHFGLPPRVLEVSGTGQK